MKSEHNIVPYIPEHHEAILYAAGLAGCDLSQKFEGDPMIGYGETRHGFGPAYFLHLAGTDYVAEPHVTWFPWVSNANKIVNFKAGMKFLAATREVLVITEKKYSGFFDHFVKKGLLRKVGHLENIPEVEEVHMYQYQREAQ